MENRKYTEKLAKYIIVLITLTIVAAVCWYLRSVIGYIILAALAALLANPVCNLICRVRIKGHGIPRWVGAILSILVVFSVIIGVITTVVPLVRDVIQDISAANINNMAQAISVPLADFNSWVSSTFPKAGPDFRIESVAVEQIQDLFDINTVSSVVGSVTSFIAKFGIALFAIIFISFFFIKDPGLVASLVAAMVPDRYDAKVRDALSESGTLVSRYFVGLFIEVLGVSLVNFLGLLLVARMGFKYSIGIAFMTGILNIIPYIGPLFGGVLGVGLSLVIRYVCTTSYGLAVGFLPFVLILVGIFVFTQLVDNYLYQPLIYSNSVKVHPLEIFIVFLIAGQIGGMAGMFAAIPAYTVVRVVAKQFLGNVKFVRELTSDTEDADKKS